MATEAVANTRAPISALTLVGEGEEALACLDEGGDAVWGGGEFDDELALVEGELSGEREELEAQAFGASVVEVDGEGEALEGGEEVGGEEVGGEDVDAEPCGVGGEDVAGQDAGAEFVFEEAMDVFDGAGLLPVPAREFDGSQHVIGGDGEIPWAAGRRVVVGGQQVALMRSGTECQIAQRGGGFGPIAGENSISVTWSASVARDSTRVQRSSSTAKHFLRSDGVMSALMLNPMKPVGPHSRSGLASHLSTAAS